MTVYMLTLLSDVNDFSGYDEYGAKARKVVQQYGGKFLIASYEAYDISAIEGVAPDVVNLAMFKDKRTYFEFYQSTEYQALIPLRDAVCKSQIVMLEKT